ncbi:C4-dicarboxylate TRAP transporter substrate-binding protein [Sedimentitalea sp.]|uniref:C4-dicarboxylate TRAP transporter substrate-binding protein n=1 Tax=Sedimentitalea sp. TaxID=2048915 RepID=UPI003296C90E
MYNFSLYLLTLFSLYITNKCGKVSEGNVPLRRRNTMKLRSLLMASAILLTGPGTYSASADTLNAAVGVGPKNMITQTMESFATYVGENSDIDIKVFSMSLLNLKETPPGIRDGVADLGFVLSAYFPAEYSETNLVAGLGMLTTAGVQVENTGAVIAGAMSDYVFNCAECQSEYVEQGQVYLGTGTSTTYMMLCTSPVTTLEDIKGKKFRSGSANFSRWAEHFGGVAVSIPGNDQYEAMGQGVIDCTMAAAAELTNYSLFDVTKNITLNIPGGNFAGVGTNNFNIDVWRGFTDEERAVLLKASARSAAELTSRYYAAAVRDIEAAREMGIEILNANAEVKAESDAFVDADLQFIGNEFIENYGVDNTDVKIAEFTKLVDKWKTLVGHIGDDQEALAQVYWDEVFSKVDPATYGMN